MEDMFESSYDNIKLYEIVSIIAPVALVSDDGKLIVPGIVQTFSEVLSQQINYKMLGRLKPLILCFQATRSLFAKTASKVQSMLTTSVSHASIQTAAFTLSKMSKTKSNIKTSRKTSIYFLKKSSIPNISRNQKLKKRWSWKTMSVRTITFVVHCARRVFKHLLSC